MTIRQLLENAKRALSPRDNIIGVEVLLAFVLGRERSFLVAHGEMEVHMPQEQRFYRVFSRFLKGEPLAYIIQKKEFYGLDFFVNKHVLIPRPETELLVEKAVAFIEQNFYTDGIVKQKRIKVLDIGTGSGCIAISIAKNTPSTVQLEIVAVDISRRALKIAVRNAKLHNSTKNIRFLQSDLLSKVKGHFDLIIANLPYIGTERFSFVAKTVREFEPHKALFGGKDGLKLYEKLFCSLSATTWKPKALLGEFGFFQRQELELLLKKYFLTDEPAGLVNKQRSEPAKHSYAKKITFFQDYAHIDRVFMVEFGSSNSSF